MEYKPFYLQGKGKNLITPEVRDTFARSNPTLKSQISNYNLELKTLELSHLESFIAWILSQQISGRVAETLLDRFRKLVGEINPQNVLNTTKEDLREIGLSRTKIEYIYNIANFYKDKNELKDHSTYSSSEILDHYTKIKGIGPWTVNMFLIFNLGRLDVAAPKDLVVRKGIQILYHLDDVPTVREASEIMKNWQDYATVGTILSWAAMGE